MILGGAVPTGPTKRAFDGWLLASAGILLFLGLASIYSVDKARFGGTFFPKQLLFAAVGALMLWGFSRINLEFWRRAVNWLYAFNLLALVGVLIIGDEKKGSLRWIDLGPFQFQPSELTKFIMILTLAAFFANRQQEIRDWKTFWQSVGLAALPMPLLMLQPHIGATMSVFVIWVSIALYAGVPGWRLGGAVLCVAAMLTSILVLPIPAFQYARERILGKLSPDNQGRSYQPHQAKLALGNGGLMGRGYTKGERIKGEHIPEQQNDFILTVLGEEGGLVATSLILTAFLFFFYRVWLVGFNTASFYGRLLAAGVLGIFGFHAIVNIGMNIGITPVIGLWLPFMSYGGTALWFCMACVGLLLAARSYE